VFRVVAGRLVSGILLGAALGAVTGTLIAGIAVIVMRVSTPMVPVGASLGLLFGATTGALLAIERGTGFSDAWMLTFADVPDGRVWLAVWDGRDVVGETLHHSGALELRRPSTAADLDAMSGNR